MKKYYINGVGAISPQKTFDNTEFLPELNNYDRNTLRCVTPEFKEYFTPTQLRRLGRMLRIGLSAATICLRDAGSNHVDGIITASGYGFLNDTAVFLNEILDQHEQHIAPTHFMQSTYNALGGMIALMTRCNGYNSTYVSRGFAFENALHDAFMQINEHASNTLLVGNYDEADETQMMTGLRAGHFKKEFISSLDLLSTQTQGTIQGEGSAFFSISGQPASNTWSVLREVVTLYKPSAAEFNAKAGALLTRHALGYADIDILVSGLSGDVHHDSILKTWTAENLTHTPVAAFKPLCGEYCTSSSFGLWLASSMLKKQVIPAWVTPRAQRSGIDNILVASQYLGANYTLMLLQRHR